MRVLHVITGFMAGGAEQQLRLLLRHTRHRADVVTLYNRGLVADAIEADGTASWTSQCGAIATCGRAVRLVQSHALPGRYEVVHVHLYRACVYGRIAARMAAIPVVVTTEHSIGDHQIEGRRKTWGVRALYLATERALEHDDRGVSEAVRRRLVDWGIRRTDQGDPQRARRRRAGLRCHSSQEGTGQLGRPRRHLRYRRGRAAGAGKRFDVLIAALAPLLGPSRRLLLVGDGRERRRLRQLADAAGVADLVIFAGERADIGRPPRGHGPVRLAVRQRDLRRRRPRGARGGTSRASTSSARHSKAFPGRRRVRWAAPSTSSARRCGADPCRTTAPHRGDGAA